MATVDWATLRGNAEIPDNNPVPPGTYDAKVDNVNVKTTSTQKTMFAITFVITAGAQAGRKVWHNMVVSPESPKALGFMFRDFAQLGLDDAYFAQNPEPGDISAALMDRPAKITVRLQKNDPSRNEIARLQDPAQVAAVPGAPSAPQPSFGATAPTAPQAPAAPGGPPARPF